MENPAYNITVLGKEEDMKRICGLILFCFGAGMALMLFLPKTLTTLLFIIGCLVAGYQLFCCQ